jgi:hypothetical protein
MEHLATALVLLNAAHYLALAICNLTKTPKDDEFVAKLYRIVEFLGGILTPRAKM